MFIFLENFNFTVALLVTFSVKTNKRSVQQKLLVRIIKPRALLSGIFCVLG